MLDSYKELISNQIEAALCMLSECVERCLEDKWQAPVANLTFCQVAFHTLFYTDVYLGLDMKSFRQQPFHVEHANEFGDYEESEDRPQQATYEKPFIKAYLQHCRDKGVEVIAAETAATFGRRPGFDWLSFSRAEVYLYNIRHIQHHAAQLSLRLRIDTDEAIPWVGSGWRNL